MSADWTACRVVRDCDGDLWGHDVVGWRLLGEEPSLLRLLSTEALATLGPLAPVLDADGLPVVATVGDLTARHIGRRVRVEGHTFATLGRILATRTLVSLRGFDTDGEWTCLAPIPHDTPAEVLGCCGDAGAL